jgi:hypothetical protein
VSSKIGVTLVEHVVERDATFRLMRLIEWAGFDLAHFSRASVTDTLPTSSVTVTMGDGATDLAIRRPERVVKTRGYVWGGPHGHVIPTVHPAFIQSGNARWSAAFINDVQKAVEVAKHGVPPQFTDYTLDPRPADALDWAKRYSRWLQDRPGASTASDFLVVLSVPLAYRGHPSTCQRCGSSLVRQETKSSGMLVLTCLECGAQVWT